MKFIFENFAKSLLLLIWLSCTMVACIIKDSTVLSIAVISTVETKELRETVKAMQPNARSNMNTYSFCEGVHASGYSRWHIRRLTGAGRKLSGGIDTKSLCDHVETGWDISVEITEHHLLNVCSACTKIYRQEQNAVTKAS